MQSRRAFLKSTLRNSALLSLTPAVPSFLARTARAVPTSRDDRILVVLFLDGGNDGVNTVIPYRDEGYARHRKELRLRTDQLIKIDDRIGLHPSLRGFGKLLESGRLAVVQGVSYPNPNLSHFRSSAIWRSARLEEPEQEGHGWIGRALDSTRDSKSGTAQSVFVGEGTLPVALRGRRSVALAMRSPKDLVLDPAAAAVPPAGRRADGPADFARQTLVDAFASSDVMADLLTKKSDGLAYPDTDLAGRLQVVAQLIKAGMPARVYYTSQRGYDTHVLQLPTHARLLGHMGDALLAFLDDLGAAGLAERVSVLVFSEFGRRVKENASKGTDHGTAGPVFLAGPRVRPGPVGSVPSLTDLESDNLKWSIDFRRVYATVLESWLGLASKEVLGGAFEPLDVLRV